MSSESEVRKLSDLRVVDLRNLLDKRGLDRSGNKQVLLDRLQKALINDGVDVDKPKLELDKKPDKRLSVSSNQQESEAAKEKSVEADDVQDAPAEAVPDNKNGNSQPENIEKENKVEVSEEKKVVEEGTGDSFIRLTLEDEEDEDEGLPEEEPAIQKSTPVVETKVQSELEDKKSTSNKTEEEPAKEIPVNSDTKKQDKNQDGYNTPVASSCNKSNLRAKKIIPNRNLWITNIAQTTRATELKQALSAYGKVIGAKVVINAKYPGACCYGYVTMDTAEDADNCIMNLNNTELSGQIIRIEKVRPDHMNAVKLNAKPKPRPIENLREDKGRPFKQIIRPESVKSQPVIKKDGLKEGDKDKKDVKTDDSNLIDKNKDMKRKSRSHDRKSRLGDQPRRSDSRGSRPKPHEGKDILTFDKIKEEHERQRLRDKERIVREESRRHREEAFRRREEDARQREVDRMQRQQRSEAARLEREREKLRMDREKLEREKAEIIRLERERQKLEREKIEIERLELQRVKIRLQEEDRRAVKRPAPYRREESYDDRKRIANERHYEESPPSPRFESPNVKCDTSTKKFGGLKDYKGRINFEKRDTYPSNKRDREFDTPRSHPPPPSRGPPTTITKYEGSSIFNLNREREIHDVRTRDNPPVVINARLVKDVRYNDRDRDRSPHFRPMREDRDRRSIQEHKADIRSPRDHRFGETAKGFDRNASTNNWHPAAKLFGAGQTPKTWGKDSWRPQEAGGNSERWNSNNVQRTSMSTAPFSGNSNMNMGPSCPPPPAINNYNSDRFEYKSMGNIRKY